MAEELRTSEPELSPFEASFAADASYIPDLDLPLEASVATASQATPPRGPDGRFQPRTYQHDPGLHQAALGQGLSEDKIARTAPDTLSEIVRELQRQELALLREQRSQLGSGIRPPQEPARQQTAPEPEAELNWDDYDPALARYLKKKDEEIKGLKAELGRQEQTRQLSAEEQRLDRLFEQINRPDLYGKGGAAALDHKSKEWRRRCAAVAEAGGVGKAQLTGLVRATGDLFGAAPSGADNAYEDSAARQPSPRADSPEGRRQYLRDNWDDGALAVPTHRKPTPASRDVRAARIVQQKLHDHPQLTSLEDEDVP